MKYKLYTPDQLVNYYQGGENLYWQNWSCVFCQFLVESWPLMPNMR